MDTYECIKTRRSIRRYQDKPVPWDDISTILDAGRLAPSSGNLQNWKFIVVQDKDKKAKIAEAALKQHWIVKASTIIVICAEPEKAKRYYGDRGEKLYTIQNCAAAVQNMLLEATNLGLGSCWVGAFDEEKVKRIIGTEKQVKILALVTIGYAADIPDEPAKFPLEVVTYIESWRRKIKDVPGYFLYPSAYWPPAIQKGKELAKKAIKKTKKLIKRRFKKNKKSPLQQ